MELDELRQAAEEKGIDWAPGETSLSEYEVTEDMELLGYVPGPEEPSLDEQAALSDRAWELFAEPEAPSYPPAHDWRDVNGDNFVTPIKDQSRCGSCVAFGCCATVESTLRVERQQPDLDVDLSEAHLFYCHARAQGRRCSGRQGGWWPPAALDAFINPGVADEQCYPYVAGDQNCTGLCDDWSSRVTTIGNWHELNTIDEMKDWIANRGPVVGTMKVFEDFVRFYTGGVYRYVQGRPGGGHCICIVGYDDNDGCWIGKNSWGTRWGENGFFRIAYGECGIDSMMYAVEDVQP